MHDPIGQCTELHAPMHDNGTMPSFHFAPLLPFELAHAFLRSSLPQQLGIRARPPLQSAALVCSCSASRLLLQNVAQLVDFADSGTVRLRWGGNAGGA
jgi:hypothetical protein